MQFHVRTAPSSDASLVAQGLDGIEVGGANSGVETEAQPHERGDSKGEGDRPRRDDERHAGGESDEISQAKPQQDAAASVVGVDFVGSQGETLAPGALRRASSDCRARDELSI